MSWEPKRPKGQTVQVRLAAPFLWLQRATMSWEPKRPKGQTVQVRLAAPRAKTIESASALFFEWSKVFMV